MGSGIRPVLAAPPSAPVTATAQMIEEAASLKAREDAVAAREKENEKRKLELDKLDKEVGEKLTKLTALQNEVQKELDYIKGLNVRDKEFRNLIKIYSAMKASKVALLLAEMTDANVAKILRAMKADQVAEILPKLDKDKAVRVSRLLGMID
ncbi:MAG: MgtE protein [Deltaproteobacteria bacterium]